MVPVSTFAPPSACRRCCGRCVAADRHAGRERTDRAGGGFLLDALISSKRNRHSCSRGNCAARGAGNRLRLIGEDDGKTTGAGRAGCTGITLSTVIQLGDGNRIVDIGIRGYELNLGDIVFEDGMRGLYDKGAAGDAGIVSSRGIIRPVPRIVLILPLRDCDALHLRRERCLRRSDKCRVRVILEHIGVRRDIGQLRVLRIPHQRVGDIRRDVDRVPGLGIIVADIADIRDHAGRGSRQLVLADRQDAAGYRFTGGQSGLS